MGYKIITDSTIDMDHKMIEELGPHSGAAPLYNRR